MKIWFYRTNFLGKKSGDKQGKDIEDRGLAKAQSMEDITQPVMHISLENQLSTMLSDISNYSQPSSCKKTTNWTC